MRMTSKMAAAVLALGVAMPAWGAAGNGIRFGGSDGRLHPFLELEGRYDSNVYVNDALKTAGDLILRVRPGLKLNVPGEVAEVEATARLDFAQYLGLEDSGSKDLSKVYGDASLGITVNKQGTVGLEIDDTFQRSERPRALSLSAGAVSTFNTLSLRVPWRPGGGALTVGFNGAWELETYERFFAGGVVCDDPANPICQADVLTRLGYNELSAGADVRWKFLPRTSAIFEGEFFKRVPFDTQVIPGVPNDPAGVRLQAGITGLVTPHMSATLEAGYGSTLSITPSLSTWLATAELEWLPTEAGRVKLTYGHDLQAERTALYEQHKLGLAARQLVAGRVGLKLGATMRALSFQGSTGSSTILTVEPGVDLEVTRWLKCELAYAYTDRAASAVAISKYNVFEYTKNEVWLKAVATY